MVDMAGHGRQNFTNRFRPTMSQHASGRVFTLGIYSRRQFGCSIEIERIVWRMYKKAAHGLKTLHSHFELTS